MLRRFPVMAKEPRGKCAEDVELGDAMVSAGELILPTPTMMNFDERIYPDPLKMDFERAITANVQLGHGPHRCAGAGLARDRAGDLHRGMAAAHPGLLDVEGRAADVPARRDDFLRQAHPGMAGRLGAAALR